MKYFLIGVLLIIGVTVVSIFLLIYLNPFKVPQWVGVPHEVTWQEKLERDHCKKLEAPKNVNVVARKFSAGEGPKIVASSTAAYDCDDGLYVP